MMTITPQNYAQKYRLKATQVAYEHCITEVSYRRQMLSTENKTKPSPQTCRISQLLDFIREQGLEPPPPNFFD
jgi:hypothetical protein